MRKVTITRTETDDSGTFGLWQSDSGFQCYTGELPWRENDKNTSCIKTGVYQCQKRISKKHGTCYGVLDVPGRSDIEIHKGNFCGDESNGLKSDVEGCIIVGRAIDEIAGQKAIISSGDALSALEADLDGEAFQLTLEWA